MENYVFPLLLPILIRVLSRSRVKMPASPNVENFIQFHVCDFAQTPLPAKSGLIVINPEYGIRLGEEARLEPVYEAIGDFFKQKCAGHKGYIFTGNMNLAKKIGLRTSRKIPFFNAQIECRLLEYELYEGTKNLYEKNALKQKAFYLLTNNKNKRLVCVGYAARFGCSMYAALGPKLLKAAATGQVESVNALLAKGAHVDTRDGFGMTALWLAATGGLYRYRHNIVN